MCEEQIAGLIRDIKAERSKVAGLRIECERKNAQIKATEKFLRRIELQRNMLLRANHTLHPTISFGEYVSVWINEFNRVFDRL